VAVAYAVALQILLTSVLVSQNVGVLVSADPARVDIICFGAGGGDGSADQGNATHPARQDCCVLCNSTTSFAVLTAIALLPHVVCGAAANFYVAPDDAAPARPHPTPRLSQGPPQNA
jgi:hypothetical protein